MKYSESDIKRLLQRESTPWDAADLSWFDDTYLAKFEAKQLHPEDHQRLVLMLANDQTVMDHYLRLKQQAAKTTDRSTYVTWRNTLVAASLAALVFVLVLDYPFMQSDQPPVMRSPNEVIIYPQPNKTLNYAPTYLIAPEHNQPFKIVLQSAQQTIWETHVLTTPRVYLPPNVRDQMTDGWYQWQVLSVDNQMLSQFTFSIGD